MKRNGRGNEKEQIKSQEKEMRQASCSCDMDLCILCFAQVWLSGFRTSSVELKFCHVAWPHSLCSFCSTWLSCPSILPVPGFRNTICKVVTIKWVISTLLVSKTHTKKVGAKEMAPKSYSVQTSQENMVSKIWYCSAIY